MIDVSQLRQFSKIAALPLVLLAAYLVLYGVWTVFDLPSREAIVAAARTYYETHGYWVVFLGALIEGALLIGWYFPGSVVIILGVVLAVESEELGVVAVVALATMGFYIASIVNYVLGRYGWHRLLLKFGLRGPIENAKQKLERRGLAIIFSTYIHPSLGAITATSAGILHLPFARFAAYSAAGFAVWNVLWGLIAYFFGGAVLEALQWGSLVISVLVLWVLALAIRHWWKRRKIVIGVP